MLTIMFIVALALVLGFTLSLVCNAVIEGVEHDVGTSIGIVVAWIAINFAAMYGLRTLGLAELQVPGLSAAIEVVTSFVILAVLLKLITTATIKQAAMIAVIYSILLAVAGWGLRSCMSAAV